MKVIIFGINGQDGFYLSSLCRSQKLEVIGVDILGDCIRGNVVDYEFVKRIIKHYLPQYIFHFAAKSTTSHEVIFENHQIISTGTLNILEAVKLFSPKTKVFITQSGLQFKNNGNPISERDPFDAASPYALARIQSVYASRYYRKLGLKIYNGYLFNHESPLRSTNYVSQFIVSRIKRILLGYNEKLELGDVTVEKEWSFAGDIVAGMLMFLKQDNFFEATIGSGKAYSIKDWLDVCFSLINKNWQDYVILKKNYVSEYKRLVSDPKTIFSIGWKPHIDFYSLAKMMIYGDDKKIENEKNIIRAIGR